MSEREFLDRIDAALARIEDGIEASGADIETSRNGGVLTLEFDNGSKMVINGQAAVQELWVAAKTGAYHYRHDGQGWRDTRDGSELFGALTRLVSGQAGAVVRLAG